MLQGMTENGASGLVHMAKSWLHAPKLELTTGAYQGGEYDHSERAYIIQRSTSGTQTPLSFTIQAAGETPLLNPAIIVRNWGKKEAEISINGRRIPKGKNFRLGIVSRPGGDDLVIWMRLDSEKPTEISIIGR